MPCPTSHPSRAHALAALSAIAAPALSGCTPGSPSGDAADGGGETAGVTASSAVALVEPGFLTVCSESDYPPFEMEEGGEMVGLDMDLGREIAEDLGVEMTNVTPAFESIQSGAALETDQCDVAISALSITEERQSVTDFSDPYYDHEVGLVTDGEDGVGSVDATLDRIEEDGTLERIVETWIPVQEN